MPTLTRQVSVAAGTIESIGDLAIPTGDLSLGWFVAIAALVIVGGMIFLNYRRKKSLPSLRSLSKAFGPKDKFKKPRKPPEDDF